MIYYMVYSSKGAPLLTENTLRNILTKSRENNKELDITGILLFSNNNFIQVLEGEKEKVISVYNRIVADNRHSLVLKKIEGYQPERIFAEWSMAYKPLSSEQYKEAEGYLNLSENTLDAQTATHEGNPVLILLRKFLN